MFMVVCGDSAEIQRYLKDNDFRLDSVSIGRHNAKIFFIMMAYAETLEPKSYFVNADNTETISAITSPYWQRRPV